MSIVVKSLNKFFGKQQVLTDLSFDVKPGRITGFLGPNGAGKSTTMKILCGQLPADSGHVHLLGQEIDPSIAHQRQQIGYLPENNPLYSDLYVREYLKWVGSVHKLTNVSDKVSEMIERTGLGTESHKKISQLSKGYRQRVGLAQALLHNPPVLILDEPTSGLDPHQLKEIRQLILELSADKTVLFSTHVLQEVEAICQEVILLNHGQKCLQSSIHELPKLHGGETLEELFVRITEAKTVYLSK